MVISNALRFLSLLLVLFFINTLLPITANAQSTTVGDPNSPELLMSELQGAYNAGFTSVTINPGTYDFPYLGSDGASIVLHGWSDFTVNGEGVTFSVGQQRTIDMFACTNITVRGITVEPKNLPFTQGKITEVGNNPDGTVYVIWQISAGYSTDPQTNPDYVPATPGDVQFSWIDVIDGATGKVDVMVGTRYSLIGSPLAADTWKVNYTNTSLPTLNVGDWIVSPLNGVSQKSAINMIACRDCTIDGVTSRSGGFGTFYENQGGGNKLLNCRVEPSPTIPPGGTELPLVSCRRDGVHTINTYPGIHIENMVFTGMLGDDCIAIHGRYRTVSGVSGNTISYTDSSAGKFVVGDPVRFSDESGYYGESTCTSLTDLGGGAYELTIDPVLPVPVGAKMCNPKYNGDGFKIINCQLGNTRSRAIITKADNGIISGCTIEYSDTAIKIGPEYWWGESGYSHNITIENNTIDYCRTGITVVTDGSVGNRNIVIRNNTIGSTSREGIKIRGTEGATISGNYFPERGAQYAIDIDSSTAVTIDNNLADYDPEGMGLLNRGVGATILQGQNNGIFYAGRPYAFTNSLSNLFLAAPFNSLGGTNAQQDTECNGVVGWILQPDGTGYAKIISEANGLALGVNGSSSTGTPLVLEEAGAGSGQVWSLTPVGNTAIELVNQLSGMSATVETVSLGETVSQNTSASSAGQLWAPSITSGLANIYEAEDATVAGPTIASGNSGYTGAGFVDYVNSTTDYVEWSIDVSCQPRTVDLSFRYALYSGDRPLEIRVNGEIVEASLSFPATGSWSTWAYTATVPATLNTGTNTVRATAIGSSGGNVDHLKVEFQVPEITVTGNGVEIASGDRTPDTADDTDFGAVPVSSSVTHIFTIANIGYMADLNLTGTPIVDISNGTGFSISTQAVTPVGADGVTTFEVTFTPSTPDQQSAIISIANDDTNENQYTFQITGTGTGVAPIADVNLPAGISLYGYTGATPIDAQAAFQTLIDNTQLSLLRWVNPANGQIKELYYTTFPSAGWINEIGNLTLGQGYVVKTSTGCTLSIAGNKSTADVSHDLPAGYSIIGYNKETPTDAQVAYQALIDSGKLELVRWVNPANGQIKELYYTTFPSAGWVNEIGNLTEGQGYIIKLNAPHTGFIIP